VTERTGESDSPFVLDDGTGKCIVHPAEAEVHARHREVWEESGRRYTELLIFPDDPLYAIGAFSTERPLDGRAAVDAEIAALLAKMKLDRNALLERFDLDRDGEIDLAEWALARQQARREVERNRAARPQAVAVHQMRKPRDGRLYMLSNIGPEDVARRYWRWKWIHLAIFFAGLGVGTGLLVQ
jgi:hypothetical protein